MISVNCSVDALYRLDSPRHRGRTAEAATPGRPGTLGPMPDLVLLRHGQSTWNAENLFTGWHDVDLTGTGRGGGRGTAGRLLARGAGTSTCGSVHTSLLTRAVRTADLALEAAGRSLAAGAPALAAERAPLRGPAGPEQGGDAAELRRGPAQGVAPQLRHAAAAPAGGRRAPTRPATPATATSRPTLLPATECLADVVRRGSSPTGRTPSSPTCWPRGPGRGRAGGGPREQPAGPAQAPRRHRRRRHRRASRSPTGIPFRLPAGRRPHGRSRRLPGRPRGGPGAAEAAARQAG